LILKLYFLFKNLLPALVLGIFDDKIEAILGNQIAISSVLVLEELSFCL
jgi:undecaprenyl-diphosphatase